MAETGDLIIKIGGDASKFKATIADVENSLKSFKANLGTTGLNIKIEALGFQETKANIKDVTEYAEGTLGSIANKIKIIKKERLTVTADASSLAPFNIALKEAVDTKKKLEQSGLFEDVPKQVAVAENSIAGLNNKLQSLYKERKLIDPDTNARAFIAINREIDSTVTKLGNLEKIGLKVDSPGGLVGGLNGIKKGSAEAGRALTSLSLVAQDLPFGFIAIQNNLPAVLQTFSQLKTEAEGNKGALKALGSALIGPAGLFLAFSAVTGAVTYAVQQYGSLGSAIDAVFGKLSPLHDLTMRASKSLEEYNKNVVTNGEAVAEATGSMQGQILKANTLAKTVLDLKQSEDRRKKALEDLKELDSERFKSFDVEKGKLDGLKTAVDNYTASVIANAVAKKFADSVAEAAKQLELQRNKLGENIKQLEEYKKANKGAEEATKRYIETNKNALEPANPTALVAGYMKLSNEITNQEAIIVSLRENYEKLYATTEGYINAASKLSTIKTPTGGGGTGKVTRGIIEEGELNNGVITSNLEYLQRVALANVRITNASVDKMLRYREKQAETSAIDALIPKKLDKIVPVNMSEELKKQIGNQILADQLGEDIAYQLELAKDAFAKGRSFIDDIFFNPLNESLNTFLETGKFTFKSFADEALKQIRRVVASELTKKLITLIANTLLPGSGSVVSTALGLFQKQSLADFYSEAYGEDITNRANFGQIRGADVNMAGQVVMTLRGSDLVGAMNRTNTTINRVG